MFRGYFALCTFLQGSGRLRSSKEQGISRPTGRNFTCGSVCPRFASKLRGNLPYYPLLRESQAMQSFRPTETGAVITYGARQDEHRRQLLLEHTSAIKKTSLPCSFSFRTSNHGFEQD